MPQQQQADQRQAAFLAALAAYQAQSAALRARVDGVVRRLWAALGSYRNADMRVFADQVVPFVAGAQQAMSALTVANLAQQAQIALDGAFAPVAVDAVNVTGASARNGADPAAVYGRSFHLVWRQLDELPREQGSVEKAIEAGANRAVELALTDVQLAKQRTAQQVLVSDHKVIGYRRVLEGAYSCGLCLVAATRRYHRSELLPIHPACDCSVAGIWAQSDPGEVIQAAAMLDGKVVPIGELSDVHDRIHERFGRSSSAAGKIPRAKTATGDPISYRDVLVTHDHGELGPVLAVRGAAFVGPNDL